MARLDEFLRNGFRISDIESDERGIDVALAKEGIRLSVRLDREEAARLLFGDRWEAALERDARIGTVRARIARPRAHATWRDDRRGPP